MLRIAAHLATIIGLAALGLALGDFASHPNPLGVAGLLAFLAVFALAVRQLYRPGGPASRRTAPPPRPAPPPEPPRRRRSSTRPTSASLFDDE